MGGEGFLSPWRIAWFAQDIFARPRPGDSLFFVHELKLNPFRGLTVSNCFTNFALSSHTSARPVFGTITLIGIQLLILLIVSRCESVGSHPFCLHVLYPFLLLLLCMYPKSITLILLRQGTYAGLRSAIHLLPTTNWIVRGSPYLRYLQLLHIS